MRTALADELRTELRVLVQQYIQKGSVSSPQRRKLPKTDDDIDADDPSSPMAAGSSVVPLVRRLSFRPLSPGLRPPQDHRRAMSRPLASHRTPADMSSWCGSRSRHGTRLRRTRPCGIRFRIGSCGPDWPGRCDVASMPYITERHPAAFFLNIRTSGRVQSMHQLNSALATHERYKQLPEDRAGAMRETNQAQPHDPGAPNASGGHHRSRPHSPPDPASTEAPSLTQPSTM